MIIVRTRPFIGSRTTEAAAWCLTQGYRNFLFEGDGERFVETWFATTAIRWPPP
jgi:hypothetical protein